MSIKVGDIVEYSNVRARVMRIEDDSNGVNIAELVAQEFNEYVPIIELTLGCHQWTNMLVKQYKYLIRENLIILAKSSPSMDGHSKPIT